MSEETVVPADENIQASESGIFTTDTLTEEEKTELYKAVSVFDQATKQARYIAATMDRNALLRVFNDAMSYPFITKLSARKTRLETELFMLVNTVNVAKQNMLKHVDQKEVEQEVIKSTVDEIINETKETVNE